MQCVEYITRGLSEGFWVESRAGAEVRAASHNLPSALKHMQGGSSRGVSKERSGTGQSGSLAGPI